MTRSMILRGALATLLLLGCDGDPPAGTDAGGGGGTDAGMTGTDAGGGGGTDAGGMTGTDAGTPITPDMNARMRIGAAGDQLGAHLCGCDMAPFASAAECEAFGDLDELDACEQSAFSDHFSAVGGFFTCLADAVETRATCIEAAGCDETMWTPCTEAYDAALMGCPTVPDADAMAYQATFDMCVATNVVGGAGTCPDDSGAVSTTGDAVFTGSTVGAGDDLAPPAGCVTAMGGGMSPDRAFRWTAPSEGMYTFDTLGSSFDTVLYVLSGCDAAMSHGCNDDVGDADLRSSVTAMLTADQEVLVVVEGFANGSAGDFTVNINAVTP